MPSRAASAIAAGGGGASSGCTTLRTNDPEAIAQVLTAEGGSEPFLLRTIADAMPQMVWSTRADGFHDYFNQRWYDFTGVPDGSTDGEGWNGIFHPEDQPLAWERWRRSLETGELYEIEYRLRRRDGVYRWVLGRALPLRDDGGRILRWFGTCTDVHEMKSTEAALAASEARFRELNETLEAQIERRTAELVGARVALEKVNRDLERMVAHRTEALTAANEEIKRFAYIVSHDLRSPLVNIMGFTSELEAAREEITAFHARALAAAPELAGGAMQEIVDGELAEAIGFIRTSTEKMDRLINAILTLSRTERRVLTAERIDMRAFFSAYQESLAHQLAAHRAEIVIGEVPDLVSDRLALEQVFANLVENAVKYLADGRPGRIEITGREDGDVVSYTVADNGRGIEAKDFERIFELFRRAGVQDRPGEGIGLAHVRALVRKLGGQIGVVSTPGVGSSFTVTLPKAHRTE